MLGAKEKSERRLGSDGAVVLGVNGVLVRPLALFVPAASQSVRVGTELTHFFCQPGRETLAYFYKNWKHTGESCCRKKLELVAGVFVGRLKSFLRGLLVQLVQRKVLSFEV